MFNSGKTSFPHVSEFKKLLYILLINIFVKICSLATGIFLRQINVLFLVKSSGDLICFILKRISDRKGASSLVIASPCGFSARLLRSDIVILEFCTFCVEVQGKSDVLSMKCVHHYFPESNMILS